MASTFAFTINGVSRISGLQRGTLNITKSFGRRSTLACQVFSSDGSWHPTINQEVIWSVDGSAVFGGYIRDLTYLGKMLRNTSSVFYQITCADYGSLLEDRLVTETFPAGQTLKQWLTTFVTNWLTIKGISLDAGQTDGPTMSQPLQVERMRADVVLQQMLLRSEYVTRGISPTKTLLLFASGSVAAPFNLTSSNRKAIGDIQVSPLWNGQKYNRVIIKFGVAGVTEYFYQDVITVSGTPSSVTLNYTPVGWYPMTAGEAFGYGYLDSSVNGRNVVANAPSPYSTGYEVDSSTPNLLTKVGGGNFTNGEVITIPYDYRYPIEVIEEDGTAATNPIELLVIDESIRTKEEAELKAQRILAITSTDTERVHYFTSEDDLDVAQTQNVNVSERFFNDDCIITDLRTRDINVHPTDPTVVQFKLRHEVFATAGDQPKRTELDTVMQWSLLGSGSGAVPGTAPNTSGGNTVPPFDTYVLFNDNMTMGAASGLRYSKTGGAGGGPETRIVDPANPTRFTRLQVIPGTTDGDFELESQGFLQLMAHDADAGGILLTTAGDVGLDAVTGISLGPGTVGAANAWNSLGGLTLLRGLAGFFIEISTSPFTVHSTSPSAANEILTFFGVSGSSAVTLPPLAGTRTFPVTSVRRMFFFVNTKTSGDLTISGNSVSELINGQTSFTIGPGGAALLGGHSSTNWRVLSGFGAVSVAGSLISPPFVLLTADPSSPADDTWWVVRTGTSPTMTVALKARISGATQTIASITL